MAVLRALLLTLASLLLISVPLSSTDPFLGFRVTDPPFTPLTYGIQEFLWYNRDAALHADWARLMVFSHVKQTFAWEDIQSERGVWSLGRADEVVDLLESKQIRLIARLSDAPEWAIEPVTGDGVVDSPPRDLAAWAEFCGVLAERYRGRIAAYQIWNEPNLSREWGGAPPSALEYVALLRACSEAIRQHDPDAILISAGLAPTGTDDARATPDDRFLQQMYDASFQQYIDVVGMHAPGYSEPELPPALGNGGHRFFTFRRIEDLRRIMVANGDAARQAAILETGWTTDRDNPVYAWFAVDEEQQAAYLTRAYQYAAEHWRPWIGLMSAIYIADPSWTDSNEERWWAITTPDNFTRPAFGALANMAKYCGDDYRPPRDPGGPEALGLVLSIPCR